MSTPRKEQWKNYLSAGFCSLGQKITFSYLNVVILFIFWCFFMLIYVQHIFQTDTITQNVLYHIVEHSRVAHVTVGQCTVVQCTVNAQES